MQNDKFWLRIIYILSSVISLAVGFLILGPRPEGTVGSLDVTRLPLVNATLNFITTILLVVAFWAIKNKKIELHKKLNLSAFMTSALFLVTYVIYHWFKAGPKHYDGEFMTIYFIILVSHILLAIIILPLALITLYRGWNNQVNQHRKIAKITFPIWLYVSITGVVIYWMLY
jgi:putative membrane protein